MSICTKLDNWLVSPTANLPPSVSITETDQSSASYFLSGPLLSWQKACLCCVCVGVTQPVFHWASFFQCWILFSFTRTNLPSGKRAFKSHYLAKTRAAPAAPATSPTVHSTSLHQTPVSPFRSLKCSLNDSWKYDKNKLLILVYKCQ